MKFVTNGWRTATDERLMEAVATGNERAFAELYRRYARRLQGFFSVRTADGAAAADFMQELFMRLWTARASYRTGRPVAPWLFTLAYNLLRNDLRHRAVEAAWAEEARREARLEEETAPLGLDDDGFDRGLARAVAELPEADHMLFALRYEEGFALADVARIMDLPLGTVKSRLHRLTNVLRKKLDRHD